MCFGAQTFINVNKRPRQFEAKDVVIMLTCDLSNYFLLYANMIIMLTS